MMMTPPAVEAPAPAFYFNTLGQPWQGVAPGLLDWENTVGFSGTHSTPASADASSGLALTSLVTGLASWVEISGVVGGTAAHADETEWGGFFGGALHLARDLGSDRGLALYAAPAWGFDKDGIASSGVTVTAVAGREPSEGWGQDVNLAVGYADKNSFMAATSPDVDDLWTWSLLAAAGHTAPDHRSAYSLEAFGAFSRGEIRDAAATPATACRAGGGAGYQRDFGSNPAGLAAWALYAGLQWEWADAGGEGDISSPALVANFSLGMIRDRKVR